MKKIGLICLALVLGLGALGVGYAMWDKTLYMDGTVQTGEVDWEFQSYAILDKYDPINHPTVSDWNIAPGFVGAPYEVGKNVGWCEGELVDGTDGDGDMSQLNLTFYNVYPGYYNSINVYPISTGSVPITFSKAIIQSDYFGPFSWTGYPYAQISLDITGDGLDDIEVQWGDSIPTQIHKGDPPPVISFEIHILQTAEQGISGTFTIEMVGVQWNEYVAP